jgi:hypothetical protein
MATERSAMLSHEIDLRIGMKMNLRIRGYRNRNRRRNGNEVRGAANHETFVLTDTGGASARFRKTAAFAWG